MPRPAGQIPASTALWLSFIGGWRDEAKARGSKAAQTYNKAYQSLAACPIEFKHPCETIQLAFIGPTIVSKIEDELRTWCEENGEEMPERPPSAGPGPRRTTSADSRKRKATKASAASEAAGAESSRAGQRSKPSSAIRKAFTKAYVPQPRSGGHGILISLFLVTSDDDREVYLSKSEVIETAELYCDTDYRMASLGGSSKGVTASFASTRLVVAEKPDAQLEMAKKSFTAWSSMSTLLSKGYVFQTGNPARYCLSDEGYDVAKAIAATEGLTQGSAQASTSGSPPKQSVPEWSPVVENGMRRHWTGILVPVKEVPASSNIAPPAGTIDLQDSSDGEVECVASRQTLARSQSASSRGADAALLGSTTVSILRTQSLPQPQKPSAPRRPRLSAAVPPPSAAGVWDKSIAGRGSRVLGDDASAPASASRSTSTGSGVTDALAPSDARTPASREALWSRLQAITLPAGSFSVHMVLDTREVRNRPHQEMTHLAHSLKQQGIMPETRPLEVGDILWIARGDEDTQHEGKEVVLDFIVERKRLDDLCSSIRDGRWKEQKFRLSASGIRQIIYLIEDFEVERQIRIFGDQILTAISSTQAIDGFMMVRSAGVDASVCYLKILHEVVKATYANTDLHVVPDSAVQRHTYLEMQGYLRRSRPATPFLTTYDVYKALNSKSANITVRDTWARMLLSIRGLSAEKVSELLLTYETPASLWSAYEALRRAEEEGPVSKEEEKMLSAQSGAADPRRKVGSALSVKIAKLLRSNEYTD